MGNDDLETMESYREITKKLTLRISELEKKNEELERLISSYRGQMRTSTPDPHLTHALQEGFGPRTIEDYIDNWPK